MKHNQVQEQLAAYALGALDARELEAIAQHLESCGACSAMAGREIAAAARMAALIPPADPPPALRSRLLASTGSTRQPSRQAAPEAAPRMRRGLSWPAMRPALGAGIAGLLAFALLGSILGLLVASQDRLSDLEGENQRVTALLGDMQKANERISSTLHDQDRFDYLINLPAVSRLYLRGTADAPTARGLVITNKDMTWGVVMLLEVEPLAKGVAYQVWLEQEGKAVSAGVIDTVDPEDGFGRLYISAFPQPLTKYSRVYVTTEALPTGAIPKGKTLLSAPITPA